MEDIRSLKEKQKAFFNTGQTKDPVFRISQLKRLRKALVAYEGRIIDALMKDFKKMVETEKGTNPHSAHVFKKPPQSTSPRSPLSWEGRAPAWLTKMYT